MTRLIDNVECTGTESRLTDCSHDTTLQNSYTSPRVDCLSCKYFSVHCNNMKVSALCVFYI